MDPMVRAEFERAIEFLADPGVELSAVIDLERGTFNICFVKRRLHPNDPRRRV